MPIRTPSAWLVFAPHLLFVLVFVVMMSWSSRRRLRRFGLK